MEGDGHILDQLQKAITVYDGDGDSNSLAKAVRGLVAEANPLKDLARKLLNECPSFPDPIENETRHAGWHDGVYRDKVTGIWWLLTDGAWIPDLWDDATVGFLRGLVRSDWDIPTAWTIERGGTWRVCWSGATHGGDLGEGSTEVAALVDALINRARRKETGP